MDKIVNSLRPRRIIWPILIGVAVSLGMLIYNFDEDTFSFLEYTWRTFYYIFLASLMMVVRDVAYMYRIMVLTDNRMSWKQAFNVIMLFRKGTKVD